MTESKDTKSGRLFASYTSQGIEIGIALIVALFFGSLWYALLVWPVVYMIGCWAFPTRVCWWCGKSTTRTDGRGNIRDKNCWRCQNRGRVYRVGARVIGKGPVK